MIEINLLPQEMRKKEPRFKPIEFGEIDLKNLPVKNIGIAIVVVLVSLHVILFVVGSQSKSRAAAMMKKYNSIMPERNSALALKSQIDLMNRKVAAIDQLMVKRFGWAEKLSSLNDSITPGIWLSELTYDEKMSERTMKVVTKQAAPGGKGQALKQSTEKVALKYLVISGYASSMGEQGTASIGKFIKSLKDNPEFYSDFSNIELGSIKSEKMQDQEVMSFKLTCMFK
jgi:hypothetical protein